MLDLDEVMHPPVPTAEERAAWRARAAQWVDRSGQRGSWGAMGEIILRLLDALDARDRENVRLVAALDGVLQLERARKAAEGL